jgi:hypothetical protein
MQVPGGAPHLPYAGTGKRLTSPIRVIDEHAAIGDARARKAPPSLYYPSEKSAKSAAVFMPSVVLLRFREPQTRANANRAANYEIVAITQ